ncbi:type IV-A pilus assembly ATPase PilB [Crenobacter sp. SG2305]|uniref:type IV-A pilus assembly ATPase PilB n=1 Tax=Crenobacter oryzisoli TaxID=3056844 RepID=UPI0025AB00BB|nr:type IV-A pilus assembly ATPase PilB [Crenobacter sp. SG2305]MDN0082166.1 type IV-A pilus assembly ATPase PilB [Crenobacter sp. SG2305]
MDVVLELAGLARALVQHKRLSPPEALLIQQQAASAGVGFVEQLVQSGKMRALDVARFAAEAFGYPLFDLLSFDPEQQPKDLIDDELMRSKRLLPLCLRGNRLTVATADPTQVGDFHAITFATGLALDIVIVEDDKLARFFAVSNADARSGVPTQGGGVPEDFQFDASEPVDVLPGMPEVDDVPVVKFINKVLLDAINSGASDIHFEPYEKYYRIRCRVDGRLREVAQPPLGLKDRIASRLKVIARLDIAEKRVPQDGRLKLRLSKHRAVDFRVSTLPTLFGEKIVLRILDQSAVSLGIDQLGFEPGQLQLVLNAIAKPYGMVLVTGPTGSGKTVSLYSFLNILNQADVNIATAEDPVEINLPGINQVNINEKAGLTFATALRAFLRQDPDILMVGEIRDVETADIAIKAAQTGHRVFSTVHTNNAPATLARLMNMGVAPFNVAGSVLLIMAQRLARRLCQCKQPLEMPREALLAAGFDDTELDGSWRPYGPVGCDECQGSGYRGRIGVYEVLPVTESIKRLIMQNGSELHLADLARAEGMLDLRRAGLLKVRCGVTSLAEVDAVTAD